MSAILPDATTASISITSFGAVADGVTNNQAAIQAAFDSAAASGKAVYIPAGTFAYSGVLTANGIAVYGAGTTSILSALDGANEALTLTGSGGSVSSLQMVSSATNRLAAWETSMIWIKEAQNYTVANVLINGSASAGIFDDGGRDGLIRNNTIQNTLADSITNTNGASNTTIANNRVVNAGDDGISIVSYNDRPIVQGIAIQGNTILNNLSGRGISVVGGNNETITGNYVKGGPAGVASIYIAAESEYSTLGVDGVTVSQNTLVNGGGAASGTGQGAITIYNSQGSQYAVRNVKVSGNQIVTPLSDAFQFVGNGAETVTLENNTDYTKSTSLMSNGNAAATVSPSGNQILDPSAYTTPLASPGGGVSAAPAAASAPATAPPVSHTPSASTPAASTPPTPAAAIVNVPAGQATVTVGDTGATVNVTAGNHMFFISGHGNTFNFSGGVETFNDTGSGQNTFNLPSAGHGRAIFSAQTLQDSDVFNLKAALSATSWDGSTSGVGSFLHAVQRNGGTDLLVSKTPTWRGTGTLLATFDHQSIKLSTILAHSVT